MNKFIAITVTACFFFLVLPTAFSISSQEALDFVSKQNKFLYDNESVELFPNVKISHKADRFFVVSVLSGESLVGLIPVSDDSPTVIPKSIVERRQLIKTAYVMRFFQQLKENSSQQGSWLFDAVNVEFFSDLSEELKKEKNQLTTVGMELSAYPSLQQDIENLKEQLDAMEPAAASTSALIGSAVSFETDFVAGPDTNRLNKFQLKFRDVFDSIAGLDSLRADYLADLDQLMQGIALTDLPIETKQSLNNAATVPAELQQFRLKADNATALNERFEQIFLNAQTSLDNMLEGLTARENRNNAFQNLYGPDDELLQKTGQQSLEQLVQFILLDEYVFRWKAQGGVGDMRTNWSKAETFYNNGSFAEAEEYAEKAKRDALRVYEAGLEEGNGLNTDLLFTGIVLLIAALIALVAVKNRKKLLSLVSSKVEEEERQIYDFEK